MPNVSLPHQAVLFPERFNAAASYHALPDGTGHDIMRYVIDHQINTPLIYQEQMREVIQP